MKVLLLTALLVSASAIYPGTRIIGGSPARAGEFPFAAAIYTSTGTGSYFCGGVLISNQWVLTAGSCVDGVLLFTIRLGSNALDSQDAVRLATDIYFLHPAYNPSTLENDLGLIEFRSPISFTDYIWPIRFPLRNLRSYEVVTAIGWGQTSDSEAGVVNDLQTVVLTALSNEECRLTFGSQITDNMVCVEGNYNEGTCRGDSGTPLIQYSGGHEAQVAAVSSFISGNGCESTDPSGYTRTYPYAEWITNVTGIVI